MKKYIPGRGDIIWLNFNPHAGHEQSGKRPAVVLSPVEYNIKVGLLICCPITNQQKGYPFEVAIPSGMKIEGVILADQVKSVDWENREAEFIDNLPKKIVEKILGKHLTLLS